MPKEAYLGAALRSVLKQDLKQQKRFYKHQTSAAANSFFMVAPPHPDSEGDEGLVSTGSPNTTAPSEASPVTGEEDQQRTGVIPVHSSHRQTSPSRQPTYVSARYELKPPCFKDRSSSPSRPLKTLYGKLGINLCRPVGSGDGSKGPT